MLPTRLVPLCLAALASTCATGILVAQDNTGYEKALARYKECITRVPFRFQVEGRETLAKTRQLDALKILVNDYAKTKDHVEYARYTIAAMLGKNFDNSDAAPLLSALRKDNTKLGDMWMWYHALRIETDRIGDTEAMTLIRESKNQTHRAVAIAALGASRNGHLKEAIVGTCLEFPKKEADRNVLLGAMTGALYENKSRVNDADYREALKAYISLLGDTLESCQGMIKATKGNIQRVVAELDSIEAKKPQTQEEVQQAGGQPYILRGSTNMHSGIRRAFGLAGRGYVETFAYVDPEALTEGCDTIFLLSDGAPSWDDFSALDKDFGEGTPVASVEQGTPGQRQPTMRYWGPYHQDDWLVEDVRRMNAFRRIRMHCIGLGEANMDLLKQLAVVGNGETFSFGDKTGDAAREEQKKKEQERAKAEAAAKAKAEAEAKAKAEQEAKDKEKKKKK